MTKKKIDYHLNRIYFHWTNLQNALNAAHNDELIMYSDYASEAPCKSLYELRERVETTTSKKISETIHKEARQQQWKKKGG